MKKAVPKASAAQKLLRRQADPKLAEFQMGFMRARKGEYAEGDRFLGLKVPQVREVAKAFMLLSYSELEKLLDSPWHEDRLLALVILVNRFKKAEDAERKEIESFYWKKLNRVNHWDLVDISTPYLLGFSLLRKPVTQRRKILTTLSKSPSVWKRRHAVLATFTFIRHGDRLDETFWIAKKLLGDPHDLIHKAVGWMLREAGKRDRARLEDFLENHAPKMPRTMLRYALEKLPVSRRKHFMAL